MRLRSLQRRIGLLLICSVLLHTSVLQAEGGKKRVVATTGIIADAVKNIAKDFVELQALMGPGVDPHLYKATPSDLRALRSADLILYNGHHLEGRMAEILERLSKQKRSVAITEGIAKEQLREIGPGLYDPHLWFDALLWVEAIKTIGKELLLLLPEHRAQLERAVEDYLSQVTSLHVWAKKKLRKIPIQHRVLITAHDAFFYFGQRYGLEVIGLQGVSTASELGLFELQNIVDTVTQRRLPAVFVESSVSQSSIKALIEGAAARGHELTLGGELYSDALGKEGSGADSYAGMFRHNVETIVSALRER